MDRYEINTGSLLESVHTSLDQSQIVLHTSYQLVYLNIWTSNLTKTISRQSASLFVAVAFYCCCKSLHALHLSIAYHQGSNGTQWSFLARYLHIYHQFYIKEQPHNIWGYAKFFEYLKGFIQVLPSSILSYENIEENNYFFIWLYFTVNWCESWHACHLWWRVLYKSR